MPLVKFRQQGPAGRFGAMALLVLTPGAALAGGLPPAPSADPLILSSGEAAAALGPAPIESQLPFYDLDWSLGIRGAYISDSVSGVRYEGLVLPSITLSHTGKILSFHGGADAQLSKTDGDEVNLDSARLSAGSALQFSPESSLQSNASLSVSQEDPHAPDVASDVAQTPLEISATGDSTYTRKFGRFNVSVGGNANRDVYGPTKLDDGTEIDNASENNTGIGGTLRLGFQLTPVLEAFGSAKVARTVFDAPSTALGTKLDGNTYSLMAGVAAKWGERLSASASAGVGIEHFDNPDLSEVRAALYDASLTFKPDDTLTLNGDFSTTIGPPGPDGSGTASIAYAATGTATYTVNDWLDWRASAGWNDTTYAGSAQTDRGYQAGVGADYKLSRHAKLSADYTFNHSDISSSPDNIHTVTLGMTFQK